MKQEQFTRRFGPSWEELQALLSRLEVNDRQADTASLPRRYRALCQQLALARHRHYTAALVEQLNSLAVRAHEQLYQRPPLTPARILSWVAEDFPRAVRRQWALHTLAALLFYGPLLLAIGLVAAAPERAQLILDPDTMAQMEQMYDPSSEHHLQAREVDSDILMFGFYIANNIGIALRTFGMGVVGGVGSALVLVHNGLVIGGVAAHLTQVGFGGPFWSFVCGHASFELTAIVISGAAGLKLGFALLAPGRRTRTQALREAAHDALVLVAGSGGMLLVAAGIEAFWSASRLVPAGVKYAAAVLLWGLVAAWLGLGGRRAG